MQKELSINKLYRITRVKKVQRSANLGVEPQLGDSCGQGEPRISVYSGTVNLYCSDEILGQPEALTDMILDQEAVTGVNVFKAIPDYIYLDGTEAVTVLSGLICEEIGGFE